MSMLASCAKSIKDIADTLVIWEDGNLPSYQSSLPEGIESTYGSLVLYGKPGREGQGLESLGFLSALKGIVPCKSALWLLLPAKSSNYQACFHGWDVSTKQICPVYLFGAVMMRLCSDQSVLQLRLVMSCEDAVLTASLSQPDSTTHSSSRTES
eukprot:1158365-Pelagomonas_calceolata.AAC.21